MKRQIKALRYIRPFFQTDPKDFAAQAKIVAQMVGGALESTGAGGGWTQILSDLKSLLEDWLKFRTTTVKRRLEHRLERVAQRLHVEFDGHYYSVPYQLVGKQVDVRATAPGMFATQ